MMTKIKPSLTTKTITIMVFSKSTPTKVTLSLMSSKVRAVLKRTKTAKSQVSVMMIRYLAKR